MPESRHNHSPPALRVVFAAWAIALVAAASLAMAVGWLQLWRVDRQQSLAQSDRQLDQLYEVIVPLFDERRALVEAKLYHGRPFDGESYDVNLGQDAFVEADERSLFRFNRSSAFASDVTTILRCRVEGHEVDPEFAGWVIRLKFVNDRLQGASAYNLARDELRRPITAAPQVQRIAEGMLVLAAGVAILCLVAAGPLGDRWRRQVASVGLAAAVLVVAVSCLHPAIATRPVLYSQTSLAAWSLVIAALMASALIPTRRRGAADAPRCSCGYDLTGNVSGTCPECGRPTARGRVDRWAEQAVAIEQVCSGTPRYAGPCLLPTGLIEAKLAEAAGMPLSGQPRQFAAVLSAAPLACYRFHMTDARRSSNEEDPILPHEQEEASSLADGTPEVADWQQAAGLNDTGDEYKSCPSCENRFAPAMIDPGDDGLTACPVCGYRSSYTADVSDSDRTLTFRLEYEQRNRASHLNDIRVKQVLTERRSLFRMRSYFVALGVTATVAAGQLGIWSYGRLMRNGLDVFVAGYLAAILGMVIAAVFCVGRIRRYTAELAVPVQTDPEVPPDFSTLSDGTQRLDEAAQNLQKLANRPKG